MSGLDKFFPGSKTIDHPKLRFWKSLIKKHKDLKPHIEFRRIREGLVFKPAVLYFEITCGDEVKESDSEPWDDILNDGLIAEEIKAISLENEGKRLGFMMKKEFRQIEIRYGDGFFNSVLIEMLNSQDFSGNSKLSDVLSNIHYNKASREGHSFDDCREMIYAAIKKYGEILEEKLKYPRELAEEILISSVAYYVDERFSVTNRKILGW